MKKPLHMHGRVVSVTHESRCLRDNRLGDPFVRELFVYLPPGYDKSQPQPQRFPVVLLLPGYAASHRSILGYNPWKKNTIERVDQQMADGECAQAIIALPDCMTRWGGSQFVDSPATGRYQTYLADEVIPFLDANFRTRPTREARAVAGRSSGGFGALRLAMDRPDVVSVVASHAGDAAFELSLQPTFVSAAIAIAQAGGLKAFAEKLHADSGGPKNSHAFHGALILAVSAAYAPSAAPTFPYCALPFDLATGDIHQDLWEQWLAHDPLRRIATHQDALKQMTWIYLDAGNQDEHGLHFAARKMASAMKTHGIPHTHEEYDGSHRGTSYRYTTSLPQIITRLTQDYSS